MPSDRRIGTKIAGFTDKDKLFGVKRDSGPYIGVVKNNADPTRSGRLQVFIPDFGGVETEESHWVTVGYASPYLGAVRRPSVITEPIDGNYYTTVNHSYGMWFTPPDIGNQVLVTFVAGDTNNGYWFACIMPDLSQHAIPAIGGSIYIEKSNDESLASALTKPPYPTVEFNELNDKLRQKVSNFLTINKPVHEDQVKILLNQGLEDDKIRGVVSSSSQRESPSKVFGISTPGNAGNGAAPDPLTGAIPFRTGGHTFVMDDGDSTGIDNLVRLRSAGGHQILMNDTHDVFYIGNSAGTVWLEFTGDGKTNLYSESDINIRSKANINFHADADINMYAKNNINAFAGTQIRQQSTAISIKSSNNLDIYGGKVGIGSGATLSMSAATDATLLAGSALTLFGKNVGLGSGGSLHLQAASDGSFGAGAILALAGSSIAMNSVPTPPVTAPGTVSAPENIPVVSHTETAPTAHGPYNKWGATSTVESTIPITAPIPTHEPFISHPSGVQAVPTANATVTPQATLSETPAPTVGPQSAIGHGIKATATAADLAAQPPNSVGIGTLTAAQITALKAQIAKNESGSYADPYSVTNQLGYIGKYQFGAPALITYGYVTSGTTNHGLTTDPNAWLPNKDGLNSVQAYFNAHDVQEKIMDLNLTANYNSLVAKGTIDINSTPEDVAGKLTVAHLLGAGGCNNWCTNGSGQDANGTTGQDYYNVGRYAITVLSA